MEYILKRRVSFMKQDRKVLEEKLYFRLKKLNDLGRVKELIDDNLIDDYINKGVKTRILTINMAFEARNGYNRKGIKRTILHKNNRKQRPYNN